ncbi:MBL fold metallo-hydrolase [Cohnella lubricantis]|uniref:MBL fold metallo-hydrolase n=1 Tax=Cohnella lubricantis TaxID=2163172 RepID=A0A841T8C4_9BACL|nr:MBL fold metallo-hydrolase [Cohnella lubricantis]MBB6677564.1 MBL fold metallo-hydrolase [Cohnella lubricantis]MBP2116550.1 glyoxylase-like metal-dependent hydrolase (beta-lactamase superfamily II) [Cohnella lubricantis]
MREMESVTQHANGWIQLKVPLPFSLRWVNAYLLPESEGGWTVIDPGLRSKETEAFWEERLAELGMDWADCRKIVVTHYHPDHYGLAGWFQQRTGAPVYLSKITQDCAVRLWSEGETYSAQLLAAFQAHGLPDEQTDGMNAHMSGVFAQVLPHPKDVRFLPEPGERFAMAGAEWLLVGGSGHALGHISFYDPEREVILCGDQVLPQITPNIGWMPGSDPDPLGSYLSSLRAMLPLGEAYAYPGHRDPFAGLATRIGEILAHHERRLRRMEELLAEAGAMTAYQMCEKLFGTKVQGNPHNMRFAMAETIAHLVRMELEGTASRRAAQPSSPIGGRELIYFVAVGG